jgi:glycosyltransferase involved in cell wall biosynthesis
MKSLTRSLLNATRRRAGHESGGRSGMLVLSWHPEEGALTAGGFRRSIAVVQALKQRSRVLILDCEPSIYRDINLSGDDELFEYSLPRLPRIAARDLRLVRAAQWGIACLKLVWIGTRIARTYRCEVIYIPNSELLPCALAGALVSRLSRSRLVMCNQNIEGVFARRVVVALHNRANAITVVSKSLARSLRDAGVIAPIEVTGVGSSHLSGHEVERSETEKRWDGIFIGRHTREKGIFDLLAIWERVVESRPTSRLVLVGACSPEIMRKIQARCTEAGLLKEHVTVAGVVSERAKHSYLGSSRIMLATSHVEGWGFAPLEALGVGIPVVCWDLPAYEESLPNNDLVTRIPLGDIDAFASEVIRALEAEPPMNGIHLVGGDRSPSWEDIALREWAVIAGSTGR